MFGFRPRFSGSMYRYVSGFIRVFLLLLFLTAAAGIIGWFPQLFHQHHSDTNRRQTTVQGGEHATQTRLLPIPAARALAQGNPWDEGTLDTIADRVYGQSDFTTSTPVVDPPSAQGMKGTREHFVTRGKVAIFTLS